MKKRLLYYQIIKQLEHKNALVVTGMRQVGKTTLLRQIYDEIKDKPKLWFDFDNPLEQKLFEDEDYRNIYLQLTQMVQNPGKKIYCFLDEIQNFPEITKVIKYLIDHYRVKFIVTGSSNFYLKNLFPESLSGRKFLFQLNPLRFPEYLYFNDQIDLKEILSSNLQSNIDKSSIFIHKKYQTFYNQYLTFGGFPEVAVNSDKQTKELILKNIVASFFEKDIRILANYSNIRELRDLLLLLVPRVGSMIDISKIASELGVDRPKIYRYLEYLQGVFMIKLLPKYSKSIDRAVAGRKKVYFSDSGILNTLGRVNDGQLFENTVINQLSNYGDIAFYNQRQSSEIDAIMDQKIAFEIKLNAVPKDYQKLLKITDKLSVKQSYLVSKKYNENLKQTITPVVL
ncbi:hypothetical protein A3C23_00475 [Candidatus Roizmanbacteria bacterium RIFCSPHIGHO2_02_FULL_37_13b]|uniref:AAA+ ATPase domain-containing protein n=1 Tax=Candidatus Roizmanbacteria bacterium RIFCSPLOWO2_02_FULL_36_11 TaxID=1802071 RepID=A0A1F7JBQ6_9BACT|nr:MAG: hypothetical protein A3C23_00475 [Candidatus Roizmanbacteria bacterium RIFCSPHIGHO2_02_FULL_37_13b]OGK53057.1 MAG: hypothetical protein A3H78_00010 [Candidatus Roizmanbacteria bacterium RIFCSPLOWO2_02_FULL_36_11]